MSRIKATDDFDHVISSSLEIVEENGFRRGYREGWNKGLFVGHLESIMDVVLRMKDHGMDPVLISELTSGGVENDPTQQG